MLEQTHLGVVPHMQRRMEDDAVWHVIQRSFRPDHVWRYGHGIWLTVSPNYLLCMTAAGALRD